MMLSQDMPAGSQRRPPGHGGPSGEFTDQVPGVPASEVSALNPLCRGDRSRSPGLCLLRSQPLQGEGNNQFKKKKKNQQTFLSLPATLR